MHPRLLPHALRRTCRLILLALLATYVPVAPLAPATSTQAAVRPRTHQATAAERPVQLQPPATTPLQPLADPPPASGDMLLSGAVATGQITVTAVDRFTLVFDAAHKWQAGGWYDLGSDPDVNLARAAGPTLNYHVIQSPLELFYPDRWNNLDTATNPRIAVVSQDVSTVVLATGWDWTTADGSTFVVTSTHTIAASGAWQVQTTLTNTSAAARTLSAQSLEYAFTNVRDDGAWQPTAAPDESSLAWTRTAGAAPYPSFTAQRGDVGGVVGSDGGLNRYWTLGDLTLDAGATWSAAWSNQLWVDTSAIVGVQLVQPRVECVIAYGNGSYVGVFGYENLNTVPVNLPLGEANHFSGDQADNGQPTVFAPGRSPDYPDATLRVSFTGDDLTWVLNGLMATATPTSPACATGPHAAFLVNAPQSFTNTPLGFTDSSRAGSAPLSAWGWDFGDGTTSDQPFPVHAFTTSGTVTVTLTVTDSAGLHDQISVPLDITTAPAIVPLSGVLFYTRFSGTPKLRQVAFQYDVTHGFQLSAPGTIVTNPALSGADGIIFAPDGDLLIGGQGPVFKVNPITGAATRVTAGTSAYHMMLDPSGTKAWAAGVPGNLGEIPLAPFGAGSTRVVRGDDTQITSIAFDAAGQAYYTRSGSGGNGSVGTINLTTFTTHRVLTNIPAAHGMVFDPFTGHLILFGARHITQIDPATMQIVSDLLINVNGLVFDQGTTDGQGHLFVASNNGNLIFLDYHTTQRVNDPRNVQVLKFLDSNLDDLAPRTSFGSAPPTAQDQTVTYTNHGPVAITLHGDDIAGLPLTFIPVSLPTHGTVTGLFPNVVYQPDADFQGTDTLTFKVNNTAHDSNTATVTINGPASVPPPNPAPTPVPVVALVTPGWIASPTNQSTASEPRTVTLADTITLTDGTLDYWPADDPTAVTTLATGLSGAGGLTLGTFDPTVLPNGSYVLHLHGTNSDGVTQDSGVLVTVAGEYKPGRVRFTITDLTVPVTGLPITIGRTYDSLERTERGDFGYGWSLLIGSPKLKKDPANNITLTQPNGQRVTFYFTPKSYGSVFGAFQEPAYTPEPGVYGSMKSDGCPIVVRAGSGYSCLLDSPDYQPTTYTYTDPYGRVFTMGADSTLKTIKDLNNNLLTFTRDGITSSAGTLRVAFDRDAAGRITRVTDPQGNAYDYTYDGAGDLTQVHVPSVTTPSRYTYDASHLVQTVGDARGKTVASATYFPDGRLETETDALGNVTHYAYDLPTHTTTVTNPDQGVVTSVSDSYGSVLTQSDPLGRVRTSVYDANHKLTRFTDGDGQVTRYTYDSKGNPISVTDALTQTTTMAYNRYGGLTTITNPAGVTWHVAYDPQYLPREITDPLGVLVRGTKDSHGSPTSRTDGAGRTTTLGYNPYGNLTRQTDGLSQTTQMDYDLLGHLTTRTDPLQGTTHYAYDAWGRLQTITDALTHATQYAYDANGNRVQDTNADRAVTQYQYDDLNRVALIRYADTTTTTLTYTWRGQQATVTDAAGSVTRYTYDLAGQLTRVRVTNAADTVQFRSTRYVYDDSGRVVQQFDAAEQLTTFAYDAVGHLLRSTDPLSHTTQYRYDPSGHMVEQEDALGQKTQYTYDIRGRMQTVQYADGATQQYAYDGAGQLVRRIDPTGRATRYDYDAVGRLIATTVADGTAQAATTQTRYDANGHIVGTVDALNHATTYGYDALGRLLQTTDPLSRTTIADYDAVGRLTAMTDGLQRQTSYQYDAVGRLLTTIAPDTTRSTARYDAVGRRIRSTDATNRATSYGYDGAGRLTAMTTAVGTPLAATTQYRYDMVGRPVQTVDPRGAVTTSAYDAAGQLRTVKDALGGTTQYAYDADGQLTTLTDANGYATRYDRDGRGRVLTTHAADGTATHQTYDAAGRVQTRTDAGGTTRQLAYDTPGRLVTTTLALGTPLEARFVTVYDAADRAVAQIDPLGHTRTSVYNAANELISTQDALGNATTYAYDAAGQLTARLDANQHRTTYGYTPRGEPDTTTFPDGSTTQPTYDAAGRVLTTRDQAGTLTRLDYDAAGQLSSFTNALSETTRYAYDVNANLVAITDPLNHTTQVAYDALDRPLTKTWPDQTTEGFGYDAVGNLTRHRLADNQTNSYGYDQRNRLTTVQHAGQAPLSFAYTPTGQRASATDARGTTRYSYDARDRLTRIATPSSLFVGYAYDAASRRTGLQTTAGSTTYGYDAADRLSSVAFPWGGTTTYGYDPAGNLTQKALPNGVTTRYGYDTLDRLTRLTQQRGGSTLADNQYTLGPTGTRVAVDELGGARTTWSYDAAERLRGETYHSATNTTTQTDYTYDANGNRLTQTRNGQTTTSTYNANDQLLTAGTVQYGYDARGNRTTVTDGSQVTRSTYNSTDQLTGITLPNGASAQYQYDADGRRVQQTAAGTPTTYLWDEGSQYGDVVQETNGSGATTAQYVYGGNELLAQQRGSTASYALHDGQGSVRGLTDSGGNLTDRYRYSAFGELLDQQGTTANPYRYTGQQFDSFSGLYNLRARFYDPGAGRFLSRDTWDVDTQNPIELNRYGYTANNPINGYDPSGHFMAGYAAGALIGARNGALIGAAGGVAFGGFAYMAASLGECGSPLKAWADRTNPWQFIGETTVQGAAAGAVFGGLAGLGGNWPFAMGIAGAAMSLYAINNELWDIYRHGTWTRCNRINLAFAALGLVGSVQMMQVGRVGPRLPSTLPPEPPPVFGESNAPGSPGMGASSGGGGPNAAGSTAPGSMGGGGGGAGGSSGAGGGGAGGSSGAGGGAGGGGFDSPNGTSGGGAGGGAGPRGAGAGSSFDGPEGSMGGGANGAGNEPPARPPRPGAGSDDPDSPGVRAPDEEPPPADGAGIAPCSFRATTPVATTHGPQAIATLAIGDHVLAYDPASGTTASYTVTNVLVHPDPVIIHLTLDDEPLETTPEHPFFTREYGWRAAGALAPGMHVRRADGGDGVVQAITVETRTQMMYNLTVAVAHTFFVGDGQWLVHNTCRFNADTLRKGPWSNARLFKTWVKQIDYRNRIPPLNQEEATLIYNQSTSYGKTITGHYVVDIDTNTAGMNGLEVRSPGLNHFVVAGSHIEVEPGVTLPYPP